MRVKRIVANISTPELDAARRFYGDILGLEVVMDHGWITTYGSNEQMRVQKAGVPIEYGPADEPWGVRRFYVRDPFGKLVNILVHAE